MSLKTLLLLFPILLVSCQKFESRNDHQPPPVVEKFESEKWKIREGEAYPYRADMLGDLMTTDTLRHKTLHEVKELLGEPTRINEGYVYYTVAENKIGLVTLNIKALVLELSDEGEVEKIMVYN
jgi:hypothetical protein